MPGRSTTSGRTCSRSLRHAPSRQIAVLLGRSPAAGTGQTPPPVKCCPGLLTSSGGSLSLTFSYGSLSQAFWWCGDLLRNWHLAMLTVDGPIMLSRFHVGLVAGPSRFLQSCPLPFQARWISKLRGVEPITSRELDPSSTSTMHRSFTWNQASQSRPAASSSTRNAAVAHPPQGPSRNVPAESLPAAAGDHWCSSRCESEYQQEPLGLS